MKLSFFLSASATFLLVEAAPTAESSLDEVLKNFKWGGGFTDLGRDGVLRSLDTAHDTVVDYVQLSEPQIAQFLKKIGSSSVSCDGHAVTSEAQLWAVPDDLVPRKLTVRRSESSEIKVLKELSAHEKRAECDPGHGCDQHDDCYEWNCLRCVRERSECVGGPTGCFHPAPRCHFDSN